MNLILILSNSLGAGKWTSFLISRGNNNVNNQRPNGPPESTYIHIRAGGLSAFQNWTPANLAGSQFSLIIFPFLWNIYMEPSWNPPKYPKAATCCSSGEYDICQFDPHDAVAVKDGTVLG